jgi:hypothetical protein
MVSYFNLIRSRLINEAAFSYLKNYCIEKLLFKTKKAVVVLIIEAIILLMLFNFLMRLP